MKTMYIIGILATLIIASFGISTNSEIVAADETPSCWEEVEPVGPWPSSFACVEAMSDAWDACDDCCDERYPGQGSDWDDCKSDCANNAIDLWQACIA